MQNQLFDAGNTLPEHCQSKLSKPSQPTSNEAAQATIPKLGGCYRAFVEALGALGKSSTAHEIAARAESTSPTPAMRETYRKRAAELVRQNKIAEDGRRTCEITGFSAKTYKLV